LQLLRRANAQPTAKLDSGLLAALGPGMTNYRSFPHDAFAALCYRETMTVQDLEKAIAKLRPDELAELRAWFDDFDAARFDEKIERDAKAGKLDRLADAAIEDFREGRAREL
jgi:hypothetical protein